MKLDDIIRKMANDNEFKKRGLDEEQVKAFVRTINVSDDSEKKHLADLWVKQYEDQIDYVTLIFVKSFIFKMLGFDNLNELMKDDIEYLKQHPELLEKYKK